MNIYRLNRGATTFLTLTVRAFAIISSILFCYAGGGSTTLASDETQFHIKWATAVVEAVEDDCSPNELWEMASGIAADHQDESRANVFICFGDLLNANASKFVGPFVDRHKFNAWVDLNVRLNSKGDGEEKTLRLVKKLTKGESLPEEAYFFLAAVILDQENVCAWQRLSTCELPTSREACCRQSLSQDPNNALQWYLLSCHLANNGKFEESVDSIKRGNSCEYCVTYPTPLPTKFNTTPIGDVAIGNGITVKNGRLNPNGLTFLVERMIQDSFPNTFVGELSKLPYLFEEEVDLPLLKVASQYCFFMGLRITYGQEPRQLWSNAGVGIANRSMRIYKDALSNRPGVFANFSQYEKQLRSFNKDFSAFKRMQPKLSEKEWRAVLQGNAAPVSDWHQQFEELKSSYPLLATQH